MALGISLKHFKDHIKLLGNFSNHVLEFLNRQEHPLKSETDRTTEPMEKKNIYVGSMKDAINAKTVEALGEFIAEIDFFV